MAEYEYQKTVNSDAIDEVLSLSPIASKYAGIVATDGTLTVGTTVALDAGEEATLDAIVDAHNAASPSVNQRITAAREFAQQLIDRWQKVIIIDGVVQAGQAHAVSTALAPSTIHASYGNLYALEEELGLVTPIATFLDAARLTAIRNEIRAYVGMPLL